MNPEKASIMSMKEGQEKVKTEARGEINIAKIRGVGETERALHESKRPSATEKAMEEAKNSEAIKEAKRRIDEQIAPTTRSIPSNEERAKIAVEAVRKEMVRKEMGEETATDKFVREKYETPPSQPEQKKGFFKKIWGGLFGRKDKYARMVEQMEKSEKSAEADEKVEMPKAILKGEKKTEKMEQKEEKAKEKLEKNKKWTKRVEQTKDEFYDNSKIKKETTKLEEKERKLEEKQDKASEKFAGGGQKWENLEADLDSPDETKKMAEDLSLDLALLVDEPDKYKEKITTEIDDLLKRGYFQNEKEKSKMNSFRKNLNTRSLNQRKAKKIQKEIQAILDRNDK